ncbi:MAG: hypothetical protein K6T59_14110 [Bryobacteraceae bacterium]|nr:hypothetical protein [Bryobacteraceae bacterium]
MICESTLGQWILRIAFSLLLVILAKDPRTASSTGGMQAAERVRLLTWKAQMVDATRHGTLAWLSQESQTPKDQGRKGNLGERLEVASG